MDKIVVTGATGYVGSKLVPTLIKQGFKVHAIDNCTYGNHLDPGTNKHPNLCFHYGDLQDLPTIDQALKGACAVIHLAALSNDPTCELDPELTQANNIEAFEALYSKSQASGVKRFIFASSSSVYGVKDEEQVTEDLPMEPLTAYARSKAENEQFMFGNLSDRMTAVAFRPGTVCGYSPRQRFDLVINQLTAQAYFNGEITVHGGEQVRSSININDMVEVYIKALTWPAEALHGQVFNAGWHNLSVREIAETVAEEVQQQTGRDVSLVYTDSHDLRSYATCSDKIQEQLGFYPRYSIQDAIASLVWKFDDGMFYDALHNSLYYNIRHMKAKMSAGND